MNCDEYTHRSSAVVLLTLLIVVCDAKTTCQKQNCRFESVTSCFLAEYTRWRKLEQVIIFKNPTAGKLLSYKILCMSKQRSVEVPNPDVTEISHLLKYSSLIRPFAWFMWFAIFLLLFSEVRFFVCCWHLESDKLVPVYQSTHLRPRRKLSSHSPASGNQNSHFEFFNKIFFGFFPVSISTVSFF